MRLLDRGRECSVSLERNEGDRRGIPVEVSVEISDFLRISLREVEK